MSNTSVWDQDAIDNEMFRDEEPCDHMDAEFDILTGRESCHCGWTRWLTTEEYHRRAEFESQAYENYHFEAEKYEREQAIAEICLPPSKGEISDAIPF